MSADLGYFSMSLGDLDRGKAFFGALFDRKLEAEPEKSPHRYAHVDGSNPPFGLNDIDGPPVRLYFRVADIEAAVARVRELGGEVGRIDERGT
jgi:predicted enzyme related to lactoylglutathione lyase